MRPTCATLFAFLALLSSLVSAIPAPVQQLVLTSAQPSSLPPLEDASIATLLSGLSTGAFSSHELTLAYLNRIDLFSDIRATITINPLALNAAVESDRERKGLGEDPVPAHRALLGIPFLVKDNIAIPAEAGPTTAGTFSLLNSTVVGPSTVVQRLLDAGAILLGTTNLDELAQAKGDHPWGWSARGGQMRSIYGTSADEALNEGYGDVCGSSGGSALSIALGLAAFTLGTQTGVSIVCPAGRAGVVGLKPGRGGMMPMRGVIPISKHLDVVGPIVRTVADAEMIWRIIKHPAGWQDGEDDSIEDCRHLQRHSPSRIRIGVPKKVFWDLDDMPFITCTLSTFISRLSLDPRFQVISKEVINITAMTSDANFDNISTVTSHELKIGINHYLKNWTDHLSSNIHSLSGMISFNFDNPSLELPKGPFPAFGHEPDDAESYADQSFLLKADALEVVGWGNKTYRDSKETLERVGWKEGLKEYFLGEDGVDVMLVPTEGISGGLASLAAVPQITRSPPFSYQARRLTDLTCNSKTVPLGYYPSNYTIEADATWPLYPYPNM
ncbi:hypothetical protein P7C70_g5129, partial [Phenoliferia sp. Uapishka_3]